VKSEQAGLLEEKINEEKGDNLRKIAYWFSKNPLLFYQSLKQKPAYISIFEPQKKGLKNNKIKQ
jgi:hypothetical protein